jgi:tartrate-resistant acid phosphatase type 5
MIKKSSIRVITAITLIFMTGIKGNAQNISDIPKGAVKFIVFGDWGRFGDDHQIPVARQMAKTAEEVHVDCKCGR